MANLGGSTFEKQVKNATRRLEARGTSRHGTDSNKSHSHAVVKKREMYLNDFKEYAENRGLEGKLNEHMTSDKVSEFMSERLEGLSAKTSMDYTSGFNSMLKGLEETKVPIEKATHEALDNLTKEHREEFNQSKSNFETNRALDDRAKSTLLDNLSDNSKIVAELQLETGLRATEAIEVVAHLDKYLNENVLSGISGKGGQEYGEKVISGDLIDSLREAQAPAYSTYANEMRENDIKSHDLRITFAAEKFEELKEAGHSYRDALQTTSEELNHHREEITEYYLSRA